MLESVTIDQLRTLRAVAEEGSFTAAARRFGQGQPAVSQAMKRLEKQLGLRLFDRSGRVPRLTAKGEAVVAAAERLHDNPAVFQTLIGHIKSGAETKLSLAVDTMFPTSALLAFIHEFAKAHPGVELALEIEFLAAVTALVRERRATLCIAGTPLAKLYTSVEPEASWSAARGSRSARTCGPSVDPLQLSRNTRQHSAVSAFSHSRYFSWAPSSRASLETEFVRGHLQERDAGEHQEAEPEGDLPTLPDGPRQVPG